MADIPNRDDLEARFARFLSKLSKAHMHRWLEELGDPPRLENMTPEMWDEMGRELRDAIRPFVEQVYLESAQRLMSETTVGVDWTLVNEAAADWASGYTFDLVTHINDTSAQRLQSAVSGYYRDTQTVGELTAGLAQYDEFTRRAGRIAGVQRCALIAVTEITRASTEGERTVANELAAQGLRMVEVWQTNNDDRVCQICGPRHGKPVGDGWNRGDGPPAHPGCRCWTNHVYAEVENA